MNSKRKDTPVSREHTGTPVLISKRHPQRKELLGKMADSRAGAGEVNIKLNDFIVPERKEALTKMIEICQKNIGTSSQGFPPAKSGQIWSLEEVGEGRRELAGAFGLCFLWKIAEVYSFCSP